MTPKYEIDQKVLDRLKYWKQKDDDWNNAMKDFCKVIAPDSYAPFINTQYVAAYIDGFTSDNTVKNWLEYYIWEVPQFKSHASVKDKNGEYNFKNDKDVIKFFKNL